MIQKLAMICLGANIVCAVANAMMGNEIMMLINAACAIGLGYLFWEDES